MHTPACMAESGDKDHADIIAQVYGWGAISEGAPSSWKLLEVDVPTVTNEVCSKAMGHKMIPGKLCAGGHIYDSCQVSIIIPFPHPANIYGFIHRETVEVL